jgi:Tfp pilus assembly protein PilN
MELLSLDKVIGVELVMMADQFYSCRICLVSKNKNSISILNTQLITGNLGAVVEAIPKSYPVALSLSGKGIIHKNIQVADGLDENQLFQNAFPTIEKPAFYVQQFNESQHAAVSIMRKQAVDELLDKLKRTGLKIYMLGFGGLVLHHVLSQLNIYDTSIQVDHHCFALDSERQFLSYTYGDAVKNQFPVKVAQETIDEGQLVAYAAAFQLLLHAQVNMVTANVDSVNDGFANHLVNEKLKRRGLVFLFAILGLLLCSFLLFTNYNAENERLAAKVGAQAANTDQVDLMKTNIAANEALLKKLNWNTGYNYGFILNEIGGSTPKQLQLQELVMNAYQTEQEKIDRIPSIKISGTTDNLTAVNNWIFVLKEKAWVKSVRLLKYQEDQDAEHYQFNLMISY